MPKKAIQGTPWYSILSNPEYTEAFAYFGAFIPEREKLIKRGYAMDGTQVEQSDLVILLLNLSAIPDDVVRGLHFGPGFVNDFKESLDAYKTKFERKYA